VGGAVAAPTPPPPASSYAQPDSGAGQIVIVGTDFGTSAPVVTLSGFQLVVVSFTNTDVVAMLPALIDPGTYTLAVSRGGTNDGNFPVSLIVEEM
jgi:hypothetical protein